MVNNEADYNCQTCGGSSKKHILHKFDDFFQPFLFAKCSENKSSGKFALYLLFTPILALAIALYLLHCLLREFYFDLSLVRLALITDSARLRQVALWKKILRFPLFFLGAIFYVGCIYYMTIPLALIFVPINPYLQIVRFKASTNSNSPL